MKNFVKVPNNWFRLNEEGKTHIGEMGQKRFVMWFILNMHGSEMNMSRFIQGQISATSEIYSNLSGFGKVANIKRWMMELQHASLIECEQLDGRTKPSRLLNIKLIDPDYSDGFQMISTDLFHDKINKLQPLGFYAYCFLFYAHNDNLGNSVLDSVGYAEYSSEFIGKVLDINKKTVLRAIKLIKDAKSLIKVTPHRHYHEEDMYGVSSIKTQPPRYTVWAKCDGSDKYYIDCMDK